MGLFVDAARCEVQWCGAGLAWLCLEMGKGQARGSGDSTIGLESEVGGREWEGQVRSKVERDREADRQQMGTGSG